MKKGATIGSVSERSKTHWDEEEYSFDEEDCSEALLRRVSGEEDLSAVRTLAITVDTTVTQVISTSKRVVLSVLLSLSADHNVFCAEKKMDGYGHSPRPSILVKGNDVHNESSSCSPR